MGFIDEFNKKFKRSADNDDLDDYEDEDDLYEEESAPAVERPSAGFAQPEQARSKIMNVASGNQAQVVLVRPERYEEVREIAQNLLERRAVVLNLEITNETDRTRIIDFLAGCVLAIDGELRKTSEKAYVIVPHNFKLSGVRLEEIEEAQRTYGESH